MSNSGPLERLVEELTGWRYRHLRFPHPLEERFRVEGVLFRARRLWLEGAIGIALYVALVALEAAVSSPGLGVRLFVVLPVVVAVNLGVLFRKLGRWQELAIFTAIACAGTVEAFLGLRAGDAQLFLGLLAVVGALVFSNGVMRLKRPYAVASLAWAALVSEPLLLAEHRRNAQAAWLLGGMELAVGLLTLLINYSHDREVRIAYLRKAQNEELVGRLSHSNEQLAAVALTDALTGLPNRAALMDRFSSLWVELAQSHAECSAVMVDIDHFKQLNDRYGHLYGDRVLTRVARLLAEALRGQDDFIARYGGEEFIILLPSTPSHLACIAAERLRSVIEIAGLPALRAQDPALNGLRATISCGVAAIRPASCPEPESLIKAADEALYEAKRQGRNRVQCRTESACLQEDDATDVLT